MSSNPLDLLTQFKDTLVREKDTLRRMDFDGLLEIAHEKQRLLQVCHNQLQLEGAGQLKQMDKAMRKRLHTMLQEIEALMSDNMARLQGIQTAYQRIMHQLHRSIEAEIDPETQYTAASATPRKRKKRAAAVTLNREF